MMRSIKRRPSDIGSVPAALKSSSPPSEHRSVIPAVSEKSKYGGETLTVNVRSPVGFVPVGLAPGKQHRGDTGASVTWGLPPATPAQADTGGVTGWTLSGVHVASHQFMGGEKIKRG